MLTPAAHTQSDIPAILWMTTCPQHVSSTPETGMPGTMLYLVQSSYGTQLSMGQCDMKAGCDYIIWSRLMWPGGILVV